jgi:hypothetical protein
MLQNRLEENVLLIDIGRLEVQGHISYHLLLPILVQDNFDGSRFVTWVGHQWTRITSYAQVLLNWNDT